jgi:hypothetical protein
MPFSCVYRFWEYVFGRNRVIIYSYSPLVEDLQMKKAENEFKRLLQDFGSSPKAAEELWKWYDSSQKKGVASF